MTLIPVRTDDPKTKARQIVAFYAFLKRLDELTAKRKPRKKKAR